MRPKLKPDVYWVPNAEGVAFIHGGGSLAIRGRSALALIDRLAPFLDGRRSLDQLLDGLPDGKREMVSVLVGSLHKAGMLKDAGVDEPHGLDESEVAAHSAEITYVDYYLDSAARRFEIYRRTPLVCVGSGLTLTALAHACLRSGTLDTTVLVTADAETDLERIEGYGRAAAAADPRQRLLVRRSNDLVEAVEAAGTDGLVLHVADAPAATRARELDRLCRLRGITSIQAVMAGDEAWIGPVSTPDTAGWESAWRRRAANLAAPDPADAGPSPWLAGPTAAIVANRVAFLAFRHVTGVAAADPDAVDPAGPGRDLVSRVDLETLQSRDHRAHPHPGAHTVRVEDEGAFKDRYAAFLAATAPEGDAFSGAAAGLYDPALGVFAELDEDDLPQLPLHLCAASVADPFGLLDASGGRIRVLRAGRDFAEARRRTGLAALCAYAALAVDRRRFDGEHAYAHDLLLDTVERLDAAIAYPALAAAGSPAATFRAPVGLAAGPDADAALTRGLLDHCVARTAATAPDRPAARLVDVPLDERGTRYARMLAAAGIAVEILDVTGPLGVPVLAFRVGGRTVAYAAACEPEAGLEQVLLSHQGVPPETEVPQLPAEQPPGERPAPAVSRPSWRALAEALHGQGLRTYAVPAGHDPAVTAVHPVLVQVAIRG